MNVTYQSSIHGKTDFGTFWQRFRDILTRLMEFAHFRHRRPRAPMTTLENEPRSGLFRVSDCPVPATRRNSAARGLGRPITLKWDG
jgi:hypothetical protein